MHVTSVVSSLAYANIGSQRYIGHCIATLISKKIGYTQLDLGFTLYHSGQKEIN